MLRTSLLTLALLSSFALAAPTIRPTNPECTTEPSPLRPQVKARASRGGILVDVVGPGAWCAATWSTTTNARTVELVPTVAVDAPASPCGTCAVRLEVRGLDRGRWTVVGGVSREVVVR